MYWTAVASNTNAIILPHNIPVYISYIKKYIANYKEVRDAGDRIDIPLVDYYIISAYQPEKESLIAGKKESFGKNLFP